jgi:hypothetical protein
MRVAIIQPYFFAYIGYFQLMGLVDRFVLLDDVTYINRGWINRNRILVQGKAHLFTVPLRNASQNVLIRDLEVAVGRRWHGKFARTLECAYRRAPFYEEAGGLLGRVLTTESVRFRDWLRTSLTQVKEYVGLETEIVESSGRYGNRHLQGQERILDICRQESATHYVNAPGGQQLYSRREFARHGITLQFVQPGEVSYRQFDHPFVPWLSILDVMMFNSPEEIRRLLGQCELI